MRERTEGGFVTSPVLADLEPETGSGLDIIAAGEDRHVYAWHADGEAVKGFPVLVEDPDKLASVNPTSNQPAFNANVPADQNKDEDQGKIVDTPAVAAARRPGQTAEHHRRHQRGVPRQQGQRRRTQRQRREHGLARRASARRGC